MDKRGQPSQNESATKTVLESDRMLETKRGRPHPPLNSRRNDHSAAVLYTINRPKEKILSNTKIWFELINYVSIEEDGNLTICINEQVITMAPRDWHELASNSSRPDQAPQSPPAAPPARYKE